MAKSNLFGVVKDLKKRRTIITPQLVRWLQSNPPYVDASADLIERLRMNGEGNSKREGRFGASSRGMCKRRQIYAYLGVPTGGGDYDIGTKRIFIDGHWRHLQWQMMLIQAGIMDDGEVPYSLPKYNVKVSLDGEGHTNAQGESGDPWMFELKGTRFMFDAPPKKHLYQIHTCFLASGHDTCVYVCEDKGNQQWREFVIEKDDTIMKEVIAELEELNEAVKTTTLPDQMPGMPSHDECKYCPYVPVCEKTRGNNEWPVEITPIKRKTKGRKASAATATKSRKKS